MGFRVAPTAATGHPFPEDGPAGSTFHWLTGGEESTCQLHQDCCERHDPGRDDPQGGAPVFRRVSLSFLRLLV